MKAININWDVDNTHHLETLPTEVIIPSGMEADYCIDF